MSEIIVKTQKELDKIKPDFNGTIYLEGGTYYNPLILKTKFEYAYVVARGTATLEMRESSRVNVMWGSSRVNVMRESSQVNDLYGEAMVSAYGTNKLTCHGYNIVRTYKSNEKKLDLIINRNSHLIIIPDFKPTFAEYAKRYPVEMKNKNTAIMYKAVRKLGNKYTSDYNRSFIYEIGETYNHHLDPKSAGSCAQGLHVAFLSWAKAFGAGWVESERALLKCEVPIKNIMVCADTDGKVRTSKLKVIEEIPWE